MPLTLSDDELAMAHEFVVLSMDDSADPAELDVAIEYARITVDDDTVWGYHATA